MIPIKVYASSIANLSDARYFAAQGAEIISFQLNASTSIDQIKEIMSWVEVPYFALEIEDLQWSDDLFEKISTLNPQIIVLPLLWKDNKEFGDYKIMQKVKWGNTVEVGPIFLLETALKNLSIDDLEKLSNAHEDVYIDTNIQPADLDILKDYAPNVGVVLRGGDEIAVGVKSFDELDEIFDAM
ncbi:MAG: hypothetical protein IPN72_15670 [Saprospiraceae bacterium]|nr:hypothetical protein [Saprospiraceae bacterium]